jgi:hypothetical protein
MRCTIKPIYNNLFAIGAMLLLATPAFAVVKGPSGKDLAFFCCTPVLRNREKIN